MFVSIYLGGSGMSAIPNKLTDVCDSFWKVSHNTVLFSQSLTIHRNSGKRSSTTNNVRITRAGCRQMERNGVAEGGRRASFTQAEKVWMGLKVDFTLFTAFYSIFIGFVMKCIFYYTLHICNMKIIKHLG